MKKNIWKRLATLTIMAALVLCLLPVGVSAEGLSGSTFESPGDELVFAVIFTCTCGEEERLQTDGQDKDVDGHSITINSFNYNFGVGTYSFEAEVTVTGCSNLEHTETFNVTDNSFTCHGMYLGHYHNEFFEHNNKQATVTIGIRKKTDSHSFDKTAGDGVCTVCGNNCPHNEKTPATCTDAEKCNACGMIFGGINSDAHNYTWTYENGYHNGVCSHNGQHIKSGSCVLGEDGKCTVCNASLAASVEAPDKILYFTDADAALKYADDYRAYTVTILKDATVNRSTVAANLVVNSVAKLTFSGVPDSETFAHVKGSVSGGGTISGQGVTLEVDEGCTGCTFELPVENYGTVTGGIFNRGLKNYGTVKGGTILGTLKNAKKNLDGVDRIGTVYADRITLGTNFRYEAEEGTTLICSHTHGTAATCMAPMNCVFCGALGEKDPDAHSPIYAATGSEINETCANGCTHNAKAALSGSVANLTYTGKEIEPFTVSYTGDAWLGGELEIVYQKNINAGFASAAIEVGGEKASRTFEILKATPKAEHFVFTPPTGLTYDGTAKTAKIDPVSTITGMGEITVTYYRDGVKLENESPAAAGIYTVSIKVGEGSNFKAPYENRSIASKDWTFTVAQAESVAAAPTEKKLTYNGEAQNLVSAGETYGNQPLYYALGLDGVWRTDIPQATDAGAYTVYWYAGSDGGNYKLTSGEIAVNITPATITVTPDAQTITYGDAAPALTYTSSGHIGTEIPVFEGELAVDSWEGGTREIKQGTLKIVDGSSFNASNYELKFVPGTLTVEQAANSWIAEPNVTDWDYGMTPNIPTADPRFGTLIREFRLESGTDADYKTEIPTAPGTYLVRFRVEETGSWTGLSKVEKLNIGRAALRVQVKDQTIKLGQQIDKTAYTVVGLVKSDTATVTLTASTDKVTVDGRIEAKVAVRNAKGEDVTDYYTLALMDSKLTIKPDTSGIDALTAENVTSADKQAINAVLEALKNAESTDKAWDDIADKCENLLTEIEAAQAAANSQNVEKVENVNSGNVKPENKADLEKAKTELEKALQDHGDNFTEAEKQVIKDKIQRMNGAVESLEKAEDITEAVAQLPKTVEPDDEATAEKILAAKAAYDGLTDHEKSLVDQTTKGKLDELVTALTAYDIVKGDGSQWIEGVDGSLSFTANGPFSKFVGIEVDGKAVDAKYYDAKSGSTIIALKESYLKQLSAGKHTITVHYSDGKTSGVFTIQLDPTVPPTGDESNIMLYGAVFAVSLAGLAALLLAAKNRKKKNA